MGAVPKRKPSTRRQGKRRASINAKFANVSSCPSCGTDKLSHFACPECGYYQTKGQKDKKNETEKSSRPKTSKKTKSN